MQQRKIFQKYAAIWFDKSIWDLQMNFSMIYFKRIYFLNLILFNTTFFFPSVFCFATPLMREMFKSLVFLKYSQLCFVKMWLLPHFGPSVLDKWSSNHQFLHSSILSKKKIHHHYHEPISFNHLKKKHPWIEANLLIALLNVHIRFFELKCKLLTLFGKFIVSGDCFPFFRCFGGHLPG